MDRFPDLQTSGAVLTSPTPSPSPWPSSAPHGSSHSRTTHGLAPRTRRAPQPNPRTRSAHRAAAREPRHLAAMLEREAFVLHDVSPAGEPGPSIDHVAVAATGVWVIASRPIALERVRVQRSVRGPATLRVGQLDQTALIDLLDRQRTLLCGALADLPHVPINTALSFTGGQFPLLGTLILGGHAILRPTELAARVGARGPLRRSESREVAGVLARRLAG